jgi:hypothetical protein
MKERGLKGLESRRVEMVEVLQEDDQISQLYCTEWQTGNYSSEKYLLDSRLHVQFLLFPSRLSPTHTDRRRRMLLN